MNGPTPRQLEVLECIAGYIREHRYPPTLRELADLIGTGHRGAHERLRALHRKGLVEIAEFLSRGIVITAAGWELVGGSPFPQPTGRGTHGLVKPVRCQSCRALTFAWHRAATCRLLLGHVLGVAS